MLQCPCQTSQAALFEGFWLQKQSKHILHWGFFFCPPDQFCVGDGVISVQGSCSRCTSESEAIREGCRETYWVTGLIICTEEGLCVHLPHPCPSWSISAPLDPAVSTLACQGRTIKCHDPFFPACPLRTLHPINFHSAFTQIPGLSQQL